jgi:hypothetical protein
MCVECGCEKAEETQRESSDNVVTSSSIKGNSN